jgi:hypothetical protein
MGHPPLTGDGVTGGRHGNLHWRSNVGTITPVNVHYEIGYIYSIHYVTRIAVAKDFSSFRHPTGGVDVGQWLLLGRVVNVDSETVRFRIILARGDITQLNKAPFVCQIDAPPNFCGAGSSRDMRLHVCEFSALFCDPLIIGVRRLCGIRQREDGGRDAEC